MSKETFETEWNSKAVNFYASDPIEMIEKHGGRVVWPVETPAGNVCLCSEAYKIRVLYGDPTSANFSKPGPYHGHGCPLYTPF